MSSLGINGLGQGLSQLFGGFGNAGPASSASGTGSTSAASSASSAGTAGSATQSGAQQVGGNRHRHGHGFGKQFEQIQDAVTSALQSAQSSGSASDPNKVIEDAIAKIFKQAGSAPFSSTTSTSATGQSAAAGDPDGDGDVDAPGQTDTDNDSSQQAFFKTLASLGVSPQQFRNDFLAAVKDAQQSGNVDVGAALKSLPKGLTLDAIG